MFGILNSLETSFSKKWS